MRNSIQALEVLPGDRALVSTVGLFRVEWIDTGEIVDELLAEFEADALIDGNTGCYRDGKPRMRKLSYAEVAWEVTV